MTITIKNGLDEKQIHERIRIFKGRFLRAYTHKTHSLDHCIHHLEKIERVKNELFEKPDVSLYPIQCTIKNTKEDNKNEPKNK